MLEAPAASLIVRRGDTFVTPTRTPGVLHGAAQLSLFEHLALRGFAVGLRETIPVASLAEADAAWLISDRACAWPRQSPRSTTRRWRWMPFTASLNTYLLSPRD